MNLDLSLMRIKKLDLLHKSKTPLFHRIVHNKFRPRYKKYSFWEKPKLLLNFERQKSGHVDHSQNPPFTNIQFTKKMKIILKKINSNSNGEMKLNDKTNKSYNPINVKKMLLEKIIVNLNRLTELNLKVGMLEINNNNLINI